MTHYRRDCSHSGPLAAECGAWGEVTSLPECVTCERCLEMLDGNGLLDALDADTDENEECPPTERNTEHSRMETQEIRRRISLAVDLLRTIKRTNENIGALNKAQGQLEEIWEDLGA